MMPRRLSTAALLLACLPTVVYGFVVPSHVGPITGSAHRLKSPPPSITRSNVFPISGDVDPAHIVPDATAIMTSTCSILTADETGGGALDIVKNIALAIVVIGGVLAGLAYVFATWMIPQAAKQLEAQTKEVDPALWREYEQKLEPGENLSMRPELMQELGDKVRERITAKYEAAVEQRKAEAKTASAAADVVAPTVSSSSSSSSTYSDIVDATIISKEESKRDSIHTRVLYYCTLSITMELHSLTPEYYFYPHL
jgi:hypothetical protein